MDPAERVLDSHKGIRALTVDFFDTLVTRSVAQPTHVFALIEKRLVAERGARWVGYAADRVMAEEQSRRWKREIDEHEDVTLDDILRELAVMRGLTVADRELLDELERHIEIEVARPVPFGTAIVNEARRRGLPVFIVSDNYMPAAHLVDFARAAGIQVDVGSVIVSCENGAMKHDGSLWPVVLRRVNAEPSEILHVGDLSGADGEIPSRLGFRTCVDSSMNFSHREPLNTTPSVLPLSFIEARNRDLSGEPGPNLARGVLGIVLAGQVLDVIRASTGRGVAGVHFTSRDGWMAHRVYGHVREERPDLPVHTYTAVSRSIVWRATINRVDASTAHRFVGDDERLSLARLGARMGCDLFGESDPDTVMEPDTARQVIVANAPRIVNASAELRARYERYLESQGLTAPGHHILVDLGWSGSVMAGLAGICRGVSADQATFEGRFLGLYWDVAANRGSIPLHGFAMDDLARLDDNMRLLGSMRLWETLLSADHGSIIDVRDGKPIFADHIDTPTLNGCQWSDVADLAVSSAVDIVLGRHPSVRPEDITRETVWAAMMQIAQSPKREEVELLAMAHHETSVDHGAPGSPLVSEPNIASNDLEVDALYDRLIRHHWLQGSLAVWTGVDECRWTVDEINRRQPWTSRVWVTR